MGTVSIQWLFMLSTSRKLNLAALLLIAGAFLLRSRSLTARLMSVWVPASIAGASLTPLAFTHYAHEGAGWRLQEHHWRSSLAASCC